MSDAKSQNTNRQVNVAVVGLGFMGVTHIRAYQQNPAAKIIAVCGLRRLPVNGILKGITGNISSSGDLDLGRDIKVYRALEEVLADPNVELVDLCVPTPLHPEHAIKALKAGKHVLCEKPLALRSAGARDIVAAAKSARGFFMPAMCMRFWPGWAWLKKVVEEKTHGRVQAARFRRMSETPAWSKGTYAQGNTSGGALFDLHIHDTDFVQFLFGRQSSVFSSGVTRGANSVDHVMTQYHYDGGPSVYAEGSWLLAKGFSMSYTLLCERATIDFDLARGADALQITEEGKEAKTIQAGEGDGYMAEIAYMLNCLQTNTAPAVVTAEDGLSAVEICEAEEQSVKTGKVVAIPSNR